MPNRLFQLLAVSLMLAACNSPAQTAPPPPQPIALPAAIAALPTAPPPTEPLPTNTLVMARPWTPTAIPTATPLPADGLGLVVGALSPETIEIVLEGDNLHKTYVVRLLGVDAPRNSPAEPWGIVAFDTLNGWLAGKVARIAQDVTPINEAGELPRYVYLSGSLVNLRMIELGLARPHFSAPDVKLQTEFETAAQIAQTAGAGLWGPDPTATPTRTPTPNLTATAAATPVLTATATITVTPAITATPAGG